MLEDDEVHQARALPQPKLFVEPAPAKKTGGFGAALKGLFGLGGSKAPQ